MKRIKTAFSTCVFGFLSVHVFPKIPAESKSHEKRYHSQNVVSNLEETFLVQATGIFVWVRFGKSQFGIV